MSVAPLTIEILVVCCLAAYLLHRYGDWRKQHVLVTLAAFVSWYFSLLIIVILPLDVSSTFYRQCVRDAAHDVSTSPVSVVTASPVNASKLLRSPREISDGAGNKSSIVAGGIPESCNQPWSLVPPNILPTLWRIIYWTSQVLTWIVLPMMQSYANAGDFTVAGKIKSALIENAIFYGSYLAIFVVCLVYLAIRPDIPVDGSSLKVLAITASNTWGLFLLVLLLGYGLVEVPRTLWNNSKRGHLLQYTYFKIAKLSTEKSEAEENLEDVLDDVKKASDTIKYNNAMRKHVDTILLKCPEALQSSVKRTADDYEDYNPTETPTVKSLVRLHKKVINCSQTYRRCECQWNVLLQSAFELEDISLNEISTKPQYVRSFGKYEGIFSRCYNPSVEWYWKCLIRPWVLKVLAVVLAFYTAMVVWSECLFFVKKPVLSLFAVFINAAKDNYDYFSIEIVSCMTILYLCVCAYYTIFKIRVFNYYYLASHHQTDENSLMFCGMLLCRLTPPLCLNFLGLIHLDSHITEEFNLEETAYTHIMGHMDVIPFISNGFNIYFPILILLLCGATYFRLGSRVLTFLGFQQFVGDDEMTQELTDEGKELVKRERRKRQRQEDGAARRRNWQEKFGEQETSNPYRDTPPYRDGAAADSAAKYKQKSGRYGGRSPQETDRLELLQSAEPVDYTGDETIMDDFASNYNTEPSSGGYQSQASRDSGGRFGATESRGNRAPPRGIFDDV